MALLSCATRIQDAAFRCLGSLGAEPGTVAAVSSPMMVIVLVHDGHCHYRVVEASLGASIIPAPASAPWACGTERLGAASLRPRVLIASPPGGPDRSYSLEGWFSANIEKPFALYQDFWEQIVSFKAGAISEEKFAFYWQIHLGGGGCIRSM